MISFSRLNDNNEFLLVMSDSSTVDFPYAMLDDTYLSNDARVIITPSGQIVMPEIDSHSKVEFDATEFSSPETLPQPSNPTSISFNPTSQSFNPTSQSSPTDDNPSHLTINFDSTEGNPNSTDTESDIKYPIILISEMNKVVPKGTLVAILKSTLNITRVIVSLFMKNLVYKEMNEETFKAIQHFIEEYFVGKVYTTEDVDWIHFEELYEKLDTTLSISTSKFAVSSELELTLKADTKDVNEYLIK